MLPKEYAIKLTESDLDELVDLFSEGKKPTVDEIHEKLNTFTFGKKAGAGRGRARVVQKHKKKSSIITPGLKSLLEKMKTRPVLTGKDLDHCKSIADSYMAGEGVRKNIQKAYIFFKWAADSGDLLSQYNVAIIAKEFPTELTLKDTTTIYQEYLIKAADNGFFEAQKLLAEYYYLGTCGFSIDFVKAVHYAEKIKDKNTGAKFTLAECYSMGAGVAQDLAKAFALYQELATKDNCVIAYVELGEAYEKGRGVEKDPAKAFKLYKIAAAKGCVQGKSEQARCMIEGIGVPQNIAEGLGLMESLVKGPEPDMTALIFLGAFYSNGKYAPKYPKDMKRAFHYFQKSSTFDHPVSWQNLGLCYKNGLGVAMNIPQAELCFERGMARGNSESIISYGDCLFQRETTAEEQQHAYELFEEIAESYDLGKFQLSRCYLTGFGVKKDTKQAIKLLQEIADKVPEAQYYLSKLYRFGLEIEKNTEKGVELLEKVLLKIENLFGYENILSNTVLDLIRIYLQGEGKVPQNLKRVSELLEIALKHDLEKTYLIVALCHLRGVCLPVDWKRSFEFLNKCLQDESPVYSAFCHYLLGLYYLHGVGTEKNIIKAFKCFQIAANNKCVPALNALGVCYLRGYGTFRNFQEGVKHFRAAIKGKNVSAVNNLAWCYLNGLGVSKDPNEAIKYLNEAIGSGSALAKRNLGWCHLLGWGAEFDRLKAKLLLEEKPVATSEKLPVEFVGVSIELVEFAGLDLADIVKLVPGSVKFEKESEIQLGLSFDEEWPSELVFDWYQQAEDVSNIQFNLAICKLDNFGSSSAPKSAKFHLDSAIISDADNPYANVLIGYCKLYGIGYEKDQKAAFEIFKSYADEPHCNENARAYLGMCYLFGYGTVETPALGIKYLESAAEALQPNAQYTLAKCLKKGFHTPLDLKRAAELFQKASEHGFSDAEHNLAICYAEGEGVPKNLSEAIGLYRKATLKGHANAENNLGTYYEEGVHGAGDSFVLEKDERMAASCYRNAAHKGCLDALCNLARCYENGIGVDQDLVVAQSLYQQALDRRAVGVEECLARIKLKIEQIKIEQDKTSNKELLKDQIIQEPLLLSKTLPGSKTEAGTVKATASAVPIQEHTEHYKDESADMVEDLQRYPKEIRDRIFR